MGVDRNIAKLRQAKNLTQRELAERAGISVNYLSRIEVGSCPKPHAKTLSRIAYALDVTMDKLLR